MLFEASVVNDPENHKLSNDACVQFIFDNADHNTNTIDGLNTSHAMGGIMSVTPSSSVSSDKMIEKLKKIPASENLGKIGFIPLKNFEKGTSEALKNVAIKDLNINNPIAHEIDFKMTDIIWIYGKWKNSLKSLGWNGLMETYYESEEYSTSKIIPLLFVNAPPSNYDTILTVLTEAATKCQAMGQEHSFVTLISPYIGKFVK